MTDGIRLFPNLEHADDAVIFSRGLGIRVMIGVLSVEYISYKQ